MCVMTASFVAEGSGLYVVVTGARSDLASELARDLAPALGLPLLALDTLRTALGGLLDPTDAETARRLGQACTGALLALAADSGGGVLDGVGPHDEALETFSGQVVEVHCTSPDRASADGDAPARAARWPVVRVDTSSRVDVEPVADEVVAAATRAAARPSTGERWVVWRQDEFGHRVEVTRRDSRVVAQTVADAMGATGQHTYGVEAV
jgi:hypothetical protein